MQRDGSLTPTSIVFGYEIISAVAHGGSAYVYKARHVKLGMPVALKQLRPELIGDKVVLQRFLREAAIIGQLQHPNVVHIHDLLHDADLDFYYIVTEYAEEGTLADLLARYPGGLPIDMFVQIGIGVCNGLEVAHNHKIVHRDIKPSNVLLFRVNENTYVPRICDFGIAREMALTQIAATSILGTSGPETSGAIGTYLYMSPEQWDGDPEIDGRSDIYSLGVLFYELLTGMVPLSGNINKVMWSHLYYSFLPPRELRPDIPEKLDQVVQRMLRKRPQDRYQAIAEVREALEDAWALTYRQPRESIAQQIDLYCRAILQQDQYARWADPADEGAPLSTEQDYFVEPESRVVPLSASPYEDGGEQRRENLLKMMREHTRLLVLGEPGMGKTAALERLAWEAARAGERIPLFLTLSEYSGDLWAQIRHVLARNGGPMFDRDPELEAFLAEQQCLFLLDGLNEVPRVHHKKVVEQIQDLMRRYPHHGYIVASRSQDLLWRDLRQEDLFRQAVVVEPIADPQICAYLIAHLGRQEGQATFDSLNERLRDMARTPLFLRMLQELRASGSEVPGNRGQLFAQYVDSLFDRDEKKLFISISRAAKKEALARLALDWQQKYQAACSPEGAVDTIAALEVNGDAQSLVHECCIHGLLQGDRQLRFMHQAVQDYFCAVAMHKLFTPRSEPFLLQQLGNRFRHREPRGWARDSWWAESFVQLAGLMDDPSELVQMLNGVNPWLALWCAIEGQPVQDRVRQSVEANTVHLLRAADTAQRKAAIRELSRIKNPRAAGYLVAALGDPQPDVVAMVSQGLAGLGESAVTYLRPCLEQEDAAARRAATRTLGRVWQIPALLRLGEPEPRTQAAALNELGDLCDPRTIDPVLAFARLDADLGVRRRAVEVLGLLGDRAAVDPLLEILSQETAFLGPQAAVALGMIGDPRATRRLIQALQDGDPALRRGATAGLGHLWGIALLVQLAEDSSGQRQAAASALGDLGDQRAVEPLIAALQDSESLVCRNAALALGRLGDPQALKPLVAILRSNRDAVVRAGAAAALGDLGGEQAIEPLAVALHDPAYPVRREAVTALGKQRGPAAADALIVALRDSDRAVQEGAIAALGGLKDEQAVEPLLALCAETDLQKQAIEAMAQIGERAVGALIAALKDEHQPVRMSAVQALGQIRSRRALDGLLSVLREEKDPEMRARAALSLGPFRDERALEALAAALENDNNQWVRFAAATGLGQSGGKAAVRALIRSLDNRREEEAVRRGVTQALAKVYKLPQLARLCDPDPSERYQAALALGQMGDERAIPALLAALHCRENGVRMAILRAVGQIWDLHQLIHLGNERPEVRKEAALALGVLGDARAVEPLISVLRWDKEAAVRVAAAGALGKMEGQRAVEALVESLDDEDKAVRDAAQGSLQQLAQSAVPYLIHALEDSDHWFRRRGAAEALGRIREPNALSKALRHRDRHVRRSAIESLAEFGIINDLDAVLQALQDADQFIRRRAAELLAHAEDIRASAPLQRALENDPDWRVRRAAAEALGRAGDPTSIESLIRALEDDDWLVRETAAKALGRFRDERAVSPLIQAMEGAWPAMWTVVEALGQQGDVRAMNCLINAIQTDEGDKYVKDAAVEALGSIGEPIQEALVNVLRTRDEASRRRAIEALGQMRDARDLAPLINALRHGEPYEVHQGAMEALIKLGDAAVESLVDVLGDPVHYDAFARQRAAIALGQIGDLRARAALSDALRDEAPLVRREAERSLQLLARRRPST